MEEAKAYANMIRIKGNHCDCARVRLYDGHRYNWHQTIHSSGTLYCPTDQTFDLKANHHSNVHYWDEIWIDGVRVYKKPWWRRLMFWIDRD